MASPVDTSVKHFYSAMSGAPVLNGAAGSLIAVLDMCLINGYDVKAVTSLVVAAGVATLTFTGTHSAQVDMVVNVAGVTGGLVALNGDQKVTVIAANQVKFATAAADGVAAGTISFKIASAGWAKPFNGTNLAVYRSLDAQGTGMYLRVDDTGTTLARVVGYEVMTDVNTGTGAFPTSAQIAGGGYWSKSNSATATANAWYVFADTRRFFISLSPFLNTTSGATGVVTRGFGDDITAKPGSDPYACSLSYSAGTGPNDSSGSYDLNADQLTHAMPRAYTGLGSCVLHASRAFVGAQANVSGVTDPTFGAFPSPVDGALRLSKKYFSEALVNAPVRSLLPGFLYVPQTQVFASFKNLDKVIGTGEVLGRKLMCVNSTNSLSAAASAGSTGAAFVDITGPWR